MGRIGGVCRFSDEMHCDRMSRRNAVAIPTLVGCFRSYDAFRSRSLKVNAAILGRRGET